MNQKAAIVLGLLMSAANASGQDEDGHQADLRTVLGYPQAYTRLPFETDLLYGGPGDLYSPFYTVFEPSSYLNFRAWGNTDAVWTPEGYKNPHRFFYVNRDNAVAMRAMARLAPHTWIRARCVVRSNFKDRAWIELVGVTSVGQELERSTLKKMVRGWALWQQGESPRALLQMEQVLVAGMPRPFAARFSMDLSRVALEAGDFSGAMMALRRARDYDSDVPEVAELVARIRRARDDLQLRVAEVQMPPTVEGPGAALQEWPDQATTDEDPFVEVSPADGASTASISEAEEDRVTTSEVVDSAGVENNSLESGANEASVAEQTVPEFTGEGNPWPETGDWSETSASSGDTSTGEETEASVASDPANDVVAEENATVDPGSALTEGPEEVGAELRWEDVSDPSSEETTTAEVVEAATSESDEAVIDSTERTDTESGEDSTGEVEAIDIDAVPEGLAPPLRESAGLQDPTVVRGEGSLPPAREDVTSPLEVPRDVPPPPLGTAAQDGTATPPDGGGDEETPPVGGEEAGAPPDGADER